MTFRTSPELCSRSRQSSYAKGTKLCTTAAGPLSLGCDFSPDFSIFSVRFSNLSWTRLRPLRPTILATCPKGRPALRTQCRPVATSTTPPKIATSHWVIPWSQTWSQSGLKSLMFINGHPQRGLSSTPLLPSAQKTHWSTNLLLHAVPRWVSFYLPGHSTLPAKMPLVPHQQSKGCFRADQWLRTSHKTPRKPNSLPAFFLEVASVWSLPSWRCNGQTPPPQRNTQTQLKDFKNLLERHSISHVILLRMVNGILDFLKWFSGSGKLKVTTWGTALYY